MHKRIILKNNEKRHDLKPIHNPLEFYQTLLNKCKQHFAKPYTPYWKWESFEEDALVEICNDKTSLKAPMKTPVTLLWLLVQPTMRMILMKECNIITIIQLSVKSVKT